MLGVPPSQANVFRQLAGTANITELPTLRAHKRRVPRRRRRPRCDCAPARVTIAAPPPRLLPRSPYGVSVHAWIIVAMYAHYQPLRAVLRQLAGYGLAIAAGTVCGWQAKWLVLFQPL